jgi:hypothetical protein
MSQQAEQVKELGPRWTREVLRRCTPREILVIAGVYGIPSVAKRLGYADIAEFFEKYTKGQS